MATKTIAAAPKQIGPEQALQELLALPLGARIDAIAKDLRRKVPRYEGIAAHDLADALEAPESKMPGDGWAFMQYAEIVSVEVTCPCIFGPIIPGRRLGWGWGDAAA